MTFGTFPEPKLNVSADVRQLFSGTLTRRTASRLLFKADRDEGRLVNLAHFDTLDLENRGAHGITEKLLTHGLTQTRRSHSGQSRGNNTETTGKETIPNDPNSELL
jgi:hypothetical protein